jgi:Fe-S-cluster containining protein
VDEWTRHGECDSCGFCCRAIAQVELVFENLVDDQEFLAVRGISPTGHKMLHVIDPCSKLNLNNNLCTIYENRPRTCREFPAEPAHVEGVPCTYYFRNNKTGEIIAGTRAIVVE